MNPEASRSWWSRNWKWCAPLGCLSMLLLAGGFLAAMVYFIFSAMKSSDVYKQALAEARANPAVIEALGTPIQDGLFVTGNIQVNGPSGTANLSFPISGPKGKGTVYLKAEKSMGQWTFQALAVQIHGNGARLELKPGTLP